MRLLMIVLEDQMIIVGRIAVSPKLLLGGIRPWTILGKQWLLVVCMLWWTFVY